MWWSKPGWRGGSQHRDLDLLDQWQNHPLSKGIWQIFVCIFSDRIEIAGPPETTALAEIPYVIRGQDTCLLPAAAGKRFFS